MSLTIERIKKLDAKRTQGEWSSAEYHLSLGDKGHHLSIGHIESHMITQADFDFIAAAPQITKQFLELVEYFQGDYNAYLRQKLEDARIELEQLQEAYEALKDRYEELEKQTTA
jgi:hypothetical protein